MDPDAHRQLREEARALVLPEDWDGRWVAALPGDACDLIVDVAAPMCLALAAEVTGLPLAEAAPLAAVARGLFHAEADLQAAALAALELMSRFQNALHVQAFAALCHTLPAFLGNAWLALLEHPSEMSRLATNPDLLPGAIEELLRFAGPSFAVYRPTSDGGRAMIRLADANRDPDVFPDPHRLRLDRRPTGHVAFGAGPHACAGAALIRAAARPAIAHFAERFSGRRVTFHAVPDKGVTLRSLRSLRIAPMLP